MSAAAGLPLALTIGEPAGIGPDLTLAVWRRRVELDLPAFYLIGEPDFLLRARARARPRRAARDGRARGSRRRLRTRFTGRRRSILPSPPRPASPTPAARRPPSPRSAAPSPTCFAGHAAAVVTNPVAKNVLYRSGFAEPGHTEFLAQLAAEATGKPVHPVMMLWSAELAVVPVTIHLPLREVVSQLTAELVFETGRIVAHDLTARFRHRAPAPRGRRPQSACRRGRRARRRRTRAIVAPAVAQLRAEGIDALGPLPADTLFHEQARAGYDVALCMYHDQALIPIKTLAFERAVNVTLGLPFVRTSPDHGTAFDIAGTGKADPSSLVAALALAARLAATAPTPAWRAAK